MKPHDPKFQNSEFRTQNSTWQMLAIDLDSTLIGRDHKVNARDADALARIRHAGLHVAICTGRNSTESAGIIGALDLAGPGIFTNGATVCDMATGRHVHCEYVAPPTVDEMVDCFGSLGHAVLVLADDPDSRQPHYLRTEHGAPHRATVDWLLANRMHANVSETIPPELMERILRLGIVVDVSESADVEALLTDRFGQRITHHSIYSKNYDCQVIEAFAPGVNKWTGILQACAMLQVDPARVVAIGDDINDIAMLENATLSFAVADAPAAIRACAKRTTAAQADSGVAQVIDGILSGEF